MAGHFFVRGVSHVLKVRIIADTDDRVRHEMEREKISAEESLRTLKKDDEQRRKWSLYLYGIDTLDPSLYDIVIHIKKLSTDDAADIICYTVLRDAFKTTPESQKMISDLALAAEVKANLFDLNPNIEVFADNGNIRIKAKAHEAESIILAEKLESSALSIRGVTNAAVDILPITLYTD